MLIKVTEFAEQIGKSGRYVRKLIETGKIQQKSLKQGPRGYLIHPEKALQDIQDSVRGWDDSGPADGVDSLDMTTAEAYVMQARYRAALTKLEYEQRSALFISKAQVEQDMKAVRERVTGIMMAIPARISPEIARISDGHVVGMMLTEALISALNEVSDGI
jgi:hypothetical protein